MGADIKNLRTRIKSVDSTLHLTKAMGLVASSKIRRSTDAMNKGREYSKAIENTVEALSTSAECAKSPFMQKREGGRTRLIIIAGDRGLAGGYNVNVFRLVRTLGECEKITIGKRACEKYGNPVNSSETFSFADAIKLSREVCNDFADDKFDRLGIVYTHFRSMMIQQPKVIWILPLEKSEKSSNAGMIFEPDEITVLNNAIPEYVAGKIMAAVRESFASEVAARRMAMDNAGKNAEDMLDALQLKYNRARQSTITQEITEIVAGSGT